MASSSPLLVIVIFQVIQSLISVIGVETINQSAWLAWSNLPFAPKSKTSQDEVRLRKELSRVQKELNATSAQDDFARWAKLRRQLDKLQEQYKQHTSSTSASRTSFDRTLNVVRIVAIQGTRFYMQWHYSKTPVYYLPRGWIPWYGEWLLSFPRAPMGSVSVQTWQFACSAVVGMIFEAVTALFALYVSSTKSKSKTSSKIKTEKTAQPIPAQ